MRFDVVAKRDLLTVHRWIGIVAGLFLLVQGISGIVVEWRDELLAATAPVVPVGKGGGLAIDTMIGDARRLHPGATIKRFDFPESRDAPAMLRLTEGGVDLLLFFAPGDGRLISDAPARSYASEFLYELHAHFMTGPNGRWILAFASVALLVLVVTGPWFWWPGRKNIRRALKVKWKGPPHRLIAELHRVTGVCLFALLGFTAVSGLTLAMMPEARWLVASSVTPEIPNAPASGPLQPLADTVLQIETTMPGQNIKSLRFTGADLRGVRAVVAAHGPHSWSIDELWIDRDGGRLIGRRNAETAHSGDALLAWVLPVHSWQWAGLPGRLFAVVLGLALMGFSASGLWMWGRRKQKGWLLNKSGA